MDFLAITGGNKLSGTVNISGAKNSALPLLSAALLAKNEMHLSNLPRVVDVKTFLALLENLGCVVRGKEELFSGQRHDVYIQSENLKSTKAIYDIVRKMRASILVLGPLLGRYGHCEVSLPGGCAIGARPVDLHLSALEKMGADISLEGGYIVAKAPKGLKGANISFDKITVTGSENIIMAASMAFGKTHLSNVAKEPEVVQLCESLAKSGVEISGIGTDELEIIGHEMQGLDFSPTIVIPDRIEAGTYLCAGAITNSKITLQSVCVEHLGAIISKLEEIGFSLEKQGDTLTILPATTLNSFNLSTAEYPGFPTDMQAQFMALATQCNGASIIEERLFENRFMHVSELQRMGASIHLRGNIATIQGATQLLGADVMATDLRASSALILAGLVASGETRIHRIYHLDRGYENLEEKLSALGAKIVRGKE